MYGQNPEPLITSSIKRIIQIKLEHGGGDILEQLFWMTIDFLQTTAGAATVMAIIAITAVGTVIHRKMQIPGLEIEPIREDTWFADREDRKRTAILVSILLTNRSGTAVNIRKCVLSGYSPKEIFEPIVLSDDDGETTLNLPEHERFLPGKEIQVKPYSTLRICAYYESRSRRLNNIIETPLVLKDSNGKRKALRITIPRHMEQIKIYRRMMS